MRPLACLVAAAGLPLAAQSLYSVSPSNLNFGNQAVGVPGPPIPITITIQGTATASFLLSFTISSNHPAFSVDVPSFSVQTGPAATTRVVNVTFTPSALGAAAGQITVSETFSESSTAVAVSGNGVPVFSVNPAAVGLGSVLVGCSGAGSFQVVSNARSAAVDFAVQSSNPLFTAEPPSFRTLASQTVAVRFTPSRGEVTSSNLDVAARLGGATLQVSTVQAQGIGVEVTPSPSVVDFGSVPVGSTAPARAVSFVTSPLAVNVSVVATSSDPAFAVSVQGAQARITFTPSREGALAATLAFAITSQDPAAGSCTVTRNVQVRGTGVPLNVTANPASLSFGQVPRGTVSAPLTTRLTNASSFSFSAAASTDAPFTVSPASFNLPAGGSQELSLTFRPAAEGPASGVLSIALTGTADPSVRVTVTVRLSGEGVAPAAISVSPESLDFGDVAVGSSLVRAAVVRNTGGSSAAVTVAAAPPAFSASPASFTLAAGGSQSVNITFSPTAAGALQGTATFSIAGGARTVALSGRGVAPNLTYQFIAGQTPSPIVPGGTFSFPGTNTGATSEFFQFEIRNTGAGPAAVSRIAVSGGAFILEGLPSLPAAIPPGAAASFRIAFQPSDPGPNTATLTIDSQTFSLRGVGLIPGVAFTGAGAALQPATQPAVGLTLPAPYATPVTGQLTLTFSANAVGSPDDPAIQFASGGRTVAFTFPPGSTTAMFAGAPQIAFQSGTVAGTITARVTLQAGGVDVTPSPAPARSFTIARAAPVLRSVALANRTATGFQAVLVAFAVTRELNSINFTFTPSGTGTLQTTSLQLDVAARFAEWIRSADAAQSGGAFTITVPFTIQGDIGALRSLSVTIGNGDGTSQSMSANF